MGWMKRAAVAVLCCALGGVGVGVVAQVPSVLRLSPTAEGWSGRVLSREGGVVPEGLSGVESAVADIGHRWRLADLGLLEPIVLSREQPTRDLYFPVPSQVPLSRVAWTLPMRFVATQGARSWVSVLVNDLPVAHHALTAASSALTLQGDAPGGLVPGGFVRMTLRLESEAATDGQGLACTVPASLVVDPSAALHFQTPAGAVSTVGDAWVLLPPVTHVLLPPGGLTTEVYQAAWRVGSALSRTRRHPAFAALPVVGDSVDTAALTVPPSWRPVPALQALANRSSVVLADNAQWAAWTLLQLAGPTASGGVVLVDAPFVQRLAGGLAALGLQAEAAGVAPSVRASIERWQSAWLGRLRQTLEQSAVQWVPTTIGGVLVLGPDAAQAFAQLADPQWAQLSRSAGATWVAQPTPVPGAAELRYSALGLGTGSFAMTYRHDWTGVLDLSQAGLSGQLPDEWVLDIATPSLTPDVSPTVSLYLNDRLLATDVLQLDGRTQRVRARLPASSLQVRNVLRAVFLRQGESGHCAVTPWTFSVTDSSHLTTRERSLAADFAGVGRALAKGGHLLVSADDLQTPVSSLNRMVWAGEAMALDASRIKVSVLPAPDQAWPTPFVAWVDGAAAQQPPMPTEAKEATAGLQEGLVVQVVSRNGGLGVAFQPRGNGLSLSAPVSLLNHGSIAAFNAQGQGQLWDADGRTDDAFADELREPWLRRNMGWWIPLLLVLSFVALLVAASVKRRKVQR